MTLTLLRTPRRIAATAVAGLSLLPLAACGGDEGAGAGGDGLARLAPATAPLYVEGAVRPEGDLKADLDGLVGKFAPGQDLERLVVKAFKGGEGGDLDYARDIEPWLGERAAFTLTGVAAGGEPDVAGMVETTDPDKAIATLRDKAKDKLEDRSHAGTDYLYDAKEKTAGGIVDETLVVGTEGAFKAVVDASKGDGLGASAEYDKVVDAVDEDALGFVYGDARKAFALAERASRAGVDAEQLEGVREYFARQEVKTFAAGLSVTATAVKLRAAATMKDGGQGDAPAETLAALPAGSWAALGLGDLGKSLSDALDGLSAASGPGFDVEDGLDQLSAQSGFDVRKDLLAWIGQTGLFVRGTSLTDIGGALVVRSKDPAATRAALAKARKLAAGAGLTAQPLTGGGIDDGFSIRPDGAPIELFAALAGERFVLAVNRAALDEALNPARKLEDDEAYKRGVELLGDDMRPAFLLDVPKLSGLVGLAASGQPGYAEAKRYIDRITTMVAGSKREGDLQLQTFAVGIR